MGLIIWEREHCSLLRDNTTVLPDGVPEHLQPVEGRGGEVY